MKKILVTFSFLFVLGWVFGQTEKITAFSFDTLTRGYRKTVLIRADSTFIQEQNQPGKTIKRKTQPTEWASLLNAVAGYKLSGLTNLPAPTNNRARDAARTSSISIKTNQKTYHSGFFDNQKPNPKLEKLMQAISQIADTQP